MSTILSTQTSNKMYIWNRRHMEHKRKLNDFRRKMHGRSTQVGGCIEIITSMDRWNSLIPCMALKTLKFLVWPCVQIFLSYYRKYSDSLYTTPLHVILKIYLLPLWHCLFVCFFDIKIHSHPHYINVVKICKCSEIMLICIIEDLQIHIIENTVIPYMHYLSIIIHPHYKFVLKISQRNCLAGCVERRVTSVPLCSPALVTKFRQVLIV
jgi:hypothetical protein